MSEEGWGAFDVGIAIHLRDPSASPIYLVHLLKLFHDGAAPPDKPVLSEHYDEIVFNTLPTDAAARAALLKGPGRDPPKYPYQEHFTSFSSEADLTAVGAARKWVAERTAEMEERLSKARAARGALQNKQLVDLGIL